MNKNIRQKLYELGYKIDFWYENGKLDAVCIAKWEGEDLIFEKKYNVEEISEVLLNDFFATN